MLTPDPIVIENGCGAEVFPALSCTVTLKLDEPMVVGVPEMPPLAAANVNPGGREPLDTDQLP